MSPIIAPNSITDGIAPPARRRRSKPPQEGTDGHRIPKGTRTGPMPPMKVTWLDGSRNLFGMPIAQPLAKGPAEGRTQAAEAARHLRKFDGIMRERWNRAGWDDKGGDLKVVVNQKGMGGNAYFATHDDGKGEMGIGVADATIGFKKSPAYSPSILLHEYVHGIVGTEVRKMPKAVQPFLDQREHRAVNESIADVLSTGLLRTNWRTGHEIRDGAPLRDLADPSVPTFNSAVRKDGGIEEHTLSGIASRAAVVAAESAGTMGIVDAWYAGIDRHYRNELESVKAPFAGRALGAWVRSTMRGAQDVGGKDSALVESVRSGWEAVGLGRYASQAQLDRAQPSKRSAGGKRRDPAAD